MKKAMYINLFVMFLLILLSVNAFSQQKVKRDSSIGDRRVVISAEYIPIIHDADKKSHQPEIIDSVKKSIEYSYLIFPRPLKNKFGKLEDIPYISLTNEPEPLYVQDFLMASLGTNINPMFRYITSGIRNDFYIFSFDFYHSSSFADIKYSKESRKNTETQTYLAHTSKFKFHKIILDANVVLGFNSFRYNGFNDLFKIPENEQQTQYNIDFEFTINPILKDTIDFVYNTKTKFDLFGDKKSNFETNFVLNGYFGKNIKSFTDFIPKNSSLSLNSSLLIRYIGHSFSSSFKNAKENNSSLKSIADSLNISKFTFSINPNMMLKVKEYELKIGFNFTSFKDNRFSNKIYIYPDLNFKYLFFDGLYIFYIGLNGGLAENSFKEITQINKYLNQVFVPFATSKSIDFNVSVLAKVNKFFDAKAFLSYAKYKDMYFFINDDSTQNKFNALPSDADVLKIGTEINAYFKGACKFTLLANYYNYKVDMFTKAYHRPNFELFLNSEFKISDKIKAITEIEFIAERYALIRSVEEKLNFYPNVDLLGEYNYVDNLKFYVKLQNILMNKDSYWANYAQYGFSALVGLKYTF